MNFSLKNFVFGVGCGIIIASFLFFVVYSFSYKSLANKLYVQAKVDILEGVDPLQNGAQTPLFIERMDEEKIAKPNEPAMTYEQALKLQPNQDGEIATAISTAVPTEIPIETQSPIETEAQSPIETETQSPIETETPTEAPKQESIGEKIVITIKKGSNASEIAERLEKEGVVDDAGKFLQYIHDQKANRKLQVGEFEFMLNSDYETALQAIIR